MPRLQAEAINAMTQAQHIFESATAPPARVSHQSSFVFRYANKGIHEALVQKLARYISGLNAITVLMRSGYTQETGIIFRTLDEIQEDIGFLAIAETNGARCDKHDQYLEAFYADSILSRPAGSLDIPKPNSVPRKKVRAHTVNALSAGINVSNALAASEALSTAYSGYVHAASENIMEMYGGNPPHFHVNGMLGTPSHTNAAENYVHRGIMTATLVAKAFGNADLFNNLYAFLVEYEVANGHTNASGSGS